MANRILVLSDDPKLLSMLQHSLSAREYELFLMQDQAENIGSAISELSPKLVILDIVMPEMKGIEACLEARRQSDVPVLMLSTWDTRNNEVRSLDPWNTDYLSEPLDMEALKGWVKNLVRRAYLSYILTNSR